MRLRFSLRGLFIGIAVFAAILGLSLRFGPHLLWKVTSRQASGVSAVPARPLTSKRPNEDLVICRIGPVSFELPQPLSNNVKVHHGIGGVFLQFADENREFAFQLPERDDGALQKEIADFPEKARLTFPRLQKETYEAASSDFSFGMSRKELRWHQWLLKYRSPNGGIKSVEYLWRQDLDGNLNDSSVFQWATVDGKWSGAIYFGDASPEEADWIRHACATLALSGDLAAFDDLDDATIKSMIQFSAAEDSVGP